MSEQLQLTYKGPDLSAGSAWVHLEQRPVSSSALTDADLQTMLAMVRNGISAKAYKPATCEAYVTGSMAYADLALYVWPSSLDLPYALSADLVALTGEVLELAMEREFDLVVGMASSVDLPFVMSEVTTAWQTPCYNRFGQEIDRPTPVIGATAVGVGDELFGVLRIRGIAHGYQRPLSFALAKDSSQAVTQIKPAVTVTWNDGSGEQSDALDIELPTCLTDLLAACDDGSTVRDKVYGSATSVSRDERVPYVYWSPCSGRILRVRNERP